MGTRKKLRLDLEELDVEVFATAEREVNHGTVRGHEMDTPDCTIYTFVGACGSYCGSSCSGPYICDCPPGPTD